mgnify:CR=1 FL=1
MPEKEKWATAKAFFDCPMPRQKMTVPDIGDIYVYGLRSGEKDDYENNVVQFNRGDRQIRLDNARAVLLQLTVRDQHGNRMFAEKDIGKLAALPAKVADPILVVARKLSGMATGEIDELVKNSQTAPAPVSED